MSCPIMEILSIAQIPRISLASLAEFIFVQNLKRVVSMLAWYNCVIIPKNVKFSAVWCCLVVCSLLQWNAVQCRALFTVLQFSAYDLSLEQCIIVSAVQCSAVQCSAVQCSAVQCSAVKSGETLSINLDRAVQIILDSKNGYFTLFGGNAVWFTLHCTVQCYMQCNAEWCSAV